MKYVGINVTVHVQDLYAENYKTMMKEIKDLNKWRVILSMFTDWKTQHGLYSNSPKAN